MKKESIVLSDPIKKVMDTAFLTIRKNQRVSEVYDLLRRKSNLFEVMDYVYVVDNSKELVGVFSIKDIFRYHSTAPVESFMRTKVISVSAKTETERVAHIALKNNIKAVPIVENKKIIGVVSSKNILQILDKTLRRDLFATAGIHKSHLDYENTLEVPVFKSVAHRVPWLIFGLAGIMVTALFIDAFKEFLEEYFMLVFFLPAIIYISDALGTQIQTLFIRDWAVMGNDLKMHKYLFKQGVINLVVSFVVSILMMATIALFWHEPYMGAVIGIATFITLLLTSFTSFFITYLIKAMGGDPALGGGPFATVVSDATTIMIYFLTARLLI